MRRTLAQLQGMWPFSKVTCSKGLWRAACGPQAADVPAAARAACAASGALYPERSGQGRATANNFRPDCGGQYQ